MAAVIPFVQTELEDGTLVVTWADPVSPEDTYEPFPFGGDLVVVKTERCVSPAPKKVAKS